MNQLICKQQLWLTLEAAWHWLTCACPPACCAALNKATALGSLNASGPGGGMPMSHGGGHGAMLPEMNAAMQQVWGQVLDGLWCGHYVSSG